VPLFAKPRIWTFWDFFKVVDLEEAPHCLLAEPFFECLFPIPVVCLGRRGKRRKKVSVLRFNINIKVPKQRQNGGRKALLTTANEEKLVEWILACGQANRPQTKLPILAKVEEISNHLTGNPVVPSNSWWKSFRKRHETLVIKKVSLFLPFQLINSQWVSEHFRPDATTNMEVLQAFFWSIERTLQDKYLPTRMHLEFR